MANCILAAAFTTCCGPLKTGSRLRVFNSLLAICKNSGFPPSSSDDRENLLTLEQYPKFMIGEVNTIICCTCIVWETLLITHILHEYFASFIFIEMLKGNYFIHYVIINIQKKIAG